MNILIVVEGGVVQEVLHDFEPPTECPDVYIHDLDNEESGDDAYALANTEYSPNELKKARAMRNPLVQQMLWAIAALDNGYSGNMQPDVTADACRQVLIQETSLTMDEINEQVKQIVEAQ